MQRLFLALWPDADTRRALARLARNLTPQPVPAHNLHLTLVFLGATPAAQAAAYRAALAGLQPPPLTLALDRIGCWRGPRVLWAGLSQPPAALLALVDELNSRLQPCGFVPEARPFAAHVTLARHHRDAPAQCELAEPIHWPAREVVLAESCSTADGVRYAPRLRWAVEG